MKNKISSKKQNMRKIRLPKNAFENHEKLKMNERE